MKTSERYEWEITQVMKRHLNNDSDCIDIGCHEGVVLKEMVRLAPHGAHLGFEPLPHLAPNLKSRFDALQIFECALSNFEGVSDFYYVKNDDSYSGLQMRSYDIEQPEIDVISVDVKCLDSLVDQSTKFSFIKIDVEGGEYHVMLGGRDTIIRSQPIIVFESSDRSSGFYGVTAEMVYHLIADKFNFEISTMSRWLRGAPSFPKQQFLEHYNNEYYFVAYPKEGEQTKWAS